eukprot:g9378.t1
MSGRGATCSSCLCPNSFVTWADPQRSTRELGPSLLGATQSSLAASSFSFDVSNAQEDRFIVYPTAGNSFAVLLPVSVVLQRDIATKRERLVARFESPQFLDLGSASSLRRNVSEAPSIGCDDVADARCSAALRLSQDGRFLYSWRDGALHLRSRRDGRLTRVVSGLFKNRHSQGAEAAPAPASTSADGPTARLSPSGGPPAAGPGISAATGSNLLLHTENEVGVFGGFSGDWQAGFPCLVGRKLVRKTGSSPVLATRVGELHGKKTKQESHEITAASVLPGDPEKAVIAFSDGALIVLRLRDRMESSKHSEEGHHYQLHGRPDRSFGRRDRACAVLGHWWLGAGSYGPDHIGGTSTKKRRVVAVAQLALHRHVVLLVTNLGEVAALCMVTRSLQRLFVLPPAPLSEETSVEVLSAEILQERRFLAVHLLLRRGRNASESDALLVSIPRSALPKCRPPGGAWHAKSSSRRPPNYVPWYQHCYRNPEAAAIFWGLLLLVVCGAYRYQPQPDLENDPEHEEAPRPPRGKEEPAPIFLTKAETRLDQKNVQQYARETQLGHAKRRKERLSTQITELRRKRTALTRKEEGARIKTQSETLRNKQESLRLGDRRNDVKCLESALTGLQRANAALSHDVTELRAECASVTSSLKTEAVTVYEKTQEVFKMRAMLTQAHKANIELQARLRDGRVAQEVVVERYKDVERRNKAIRSCISGITRPTALSPRGISTY